MKLKVGEIVACYEGINKFLELEMESDLACRLRVMSDKLQDEYKKYLKQRDALIAKHGDKANPTYIRPDMPGWKAFNDELSLASEAEVDMKVYTIKLSALMSTKTRGDVIAAFSKLIVDDVNTDMVEV
jgi:hypothetical protein